MAAKPISISISANENPNPSPLSTYLGLSFAVFLGLLPKSSIPYLSSLQSRNRILSLKLFQAEDQLKTLRSRRKEDSKANARVVEIFASHRHAWQQEERRLLDQIEAANEEIERLRGRVGELEREVRERDEMLDLVAARGEEEEEREEVRVRVSEGLGFGEMDEMAAAYYAGEKERDSKRWVERATSGWQQVKNFFFSLFLYFF